jgi:hypothetical protein
MSTETIADVSTKLEEAVASLRSGKPDPETMKEAGEEMDRMREETKKRIGIVDVAVHLIRDARK